MQNKTKLTFTNPNPNKPHLTGQAYITFLNTNGGINKFGLQLTSNAITKNGLFGGGTLTTLLNPTNRICNANGLPMPNGYGHASQILWACVNGLPQQAINNGKLVKLPKQGLAPITTVPTNTNKVVPLAHIQHLHRASGSCILRNTATTATATPNNMVLALLNGSKSLKATAKNITLGVPMAKLVALA